MENPCKIVFFGDSITKEYVPDFERVIMKLYSDHKIEIINAGEIGETSSDALKRLNMLLKEKPDVVVVSFGMNDWRKCVSVEEFKKNLCLIVDRFQNIGSRVILTTINPVKGIFSGKKNNVVCRYNAVIRLVARQKRIKIADVHSLWKKRIKPSSKGLRDDIHPNPKGRRIYVESLLYIVSRENTVILWQYNGRECKCNYNCPYCYYADSPKKENFFFGNIVQWKKSFKDAFGNQNLVFYLSFGEPMLGKAFYDVVKMIESQPNWQLRITTNLSQPLGRLVKTRLAKERRLHINASFHPLSVSKEEFLEKALFLRKHGIEVPIIYVMYPAFLKRFKEDFDFFNKHNFIIHVRRFKGRYNGKNYPKAYTDKERQFIAKYCDDGTIKYMLNEKPVFNRLTYSGLHFFIVDSTGNIGYDSDCFEFHSKYRTRFGNVLQPESLRLNFSPTSYPKGHIQGTVDGVSNYLEAKYKELKGNNVLSFAKQGGVYHVSKGVFYKNLDKDFNDSRVRAKYFFPSRSIKDEFFKIVVYGLRKYLQYSFGRSLR